MSTDEDQARHRLLEVRIQIAAAKTLTKLAEDRRREAVLAARDAGLTLAEIATALSMTTTRVHQIVNKTR